MSAPHIRPGRPEDEQPLRRLDRETWSPSTRSHPGRARRPLLPGALRPRRPPGRGARRPGRRLRPARLPTDLAANAHVRRINGLAVADAARGRGVGRALLRAAVEEARGTGARRITLRVLGHNTAARRLYESEGFVVEGVQPEEFCLDGTYVDDVMMGRSLR